MAWSPQPSALAMMCSMDVIVSPHTQFVAARDR